jgi:hypothetical protein
MLILKWLLIISMGHPRFGILLFFRKFPDFSTGTERQMARAVLSYRPSGAAGLPYEATAAQARIPADSVASLREMESFFIL